jgi:hypothetical protein
MKKNEPKSLEHDAKANIRAGAKILPLAMEAQLSRSDETAKVTMRLPKKLVNRVKIFAIRTSSTLQQVTEEALEAHLKAKGEVR